MKRFLIIICLFGGITSALAEDPVALTLRQVYDLTLNQSEALKRREQDVRIAEAQYKQAFAALLPNIHLNATERIRSNDQYGISDQPGSTVDDIGGGPTLRRSSRDEREFQTFFSLRQPLFTGFRDYFIAQALKSEIKASEYDHSRFKEQLYLDVATVYFQIVLFEKDIALLTQEEQVLSERIKELEHFISLGRSRSSEVLAVESDLAEVRAAKENTKGAFNASKELLAFLIGVDSENINLTANNPTPPLSALDEYLDKVSSRFDLQALTARQDSATKQLTASEREHWPQINLEGNAYPYEDPDLNREWDAFVRLDIPVFEGGAINARIDQSRAQLRQSELLLAETKRSAVREVRTAHAQSSASIAQVQALRRLVEAAEKNRVSQLGDYKLGVVNNLEVLDAIRSEQTAKRRLLAAETALQINICSLDVATGGIT